MFKKILIANRGEIACRVIKTCRRLGIVAAVVYSDADESALHVQMADEAIRIGSAAASDSYLKTSAIIQAAKKVKAEAIHPGYGFLSENADFVQAVEKAGLVFIGPSAKVIRQMGDKVAARKLAESAGVPVIPGTKGEISDSEIEEAAKSIGFPLMIKAADGGGGMGIRIVHDASELVEAAARARAQAQSAFGSNRIYMERRVERASHVEVQILGDKFGNAVHFYERDCSVQRRNQKVIEETPCAKLTTHMRDKLTAASVNLAKSIGYSNAGTIEFLLDQNGDEFFFLEMNTRLQVEHPITEMVTGIDLVEMQLRVANDEKLPLRQGDISVSGAAIEARIYPEDPVLLLPTAGTLSKLREPEGDHVRVDSSLYQGYEVQPHYESMMAKLIVHGDDRAHAIRNLEKALADYVLEGVVTNIPLIERIIRQAAFKEAAYSNNFLEKLLTGELDNADQELVAAIAVAMIRGQDTATRSIPSRWKMHGRRMLMVNRLNGVSI